ncbi:MAG: HlyD family efflux transporter periplasmic adaptor subunit [Planctomycetes bacterium]|nr:HlyD family efflux transporter periplasmic adaptor subunit [Planctomycetota bacterium]
MSRTSIRVLAFAAFSGLLLAAAQSEDSAPTSPRPAEAKRPAKKAGAQSPKKKLYTVRKEPLRKLVKLQGLFEAARMHPVSVHLKEWSSLEVVSAVPHGKFVKKGERLVVFDTSKIDKTIAELQIQVRLGELAYREAQENFKALQQSLPLDREAAARNRKMAQEDLDRFLKIDLPLSRKSAEMSLKAAVNWLTYEKEELRQLEEMYKADDLTEETEEIILKRQRDTVEQAEFRVEEAKVRHDQTLHVTLPRREQSLKEKLKRQEIAFAQMEATAAIKLEKAQWDLKRQAMEQQKSQERLTKLMADRKAMEVVAPADGIVYYGQATRGRWPDVTSLESKLRPGGQVASKEVFLTVVEPRPLFVRANVPESDLDGIKAGLKSVVLPVGFPEKRLPGRVRSISRVPIASGKFEIRIEVPLDKSQDDIVPGMACTVRILAYENPNALTVPANAVFTEDTLEGRHYVYVPQQDGSAEKRFIEGRPVGERFEVRSGLREGDKILATKPEETS